MEESKKEDHKETLNNLLKGSWQKIMLLCGKQLIKAGTNILAKIGEEESQVIVSGESTPPAYSVTSPIENKTELHSVGDSNYPDKVDELNDSLIETSNEENAEKEINDDAESYGISSVAEVGDFPAIDVDSSLSSIKLVRNAANLINEYDRQATEAEDNGFRTLYNDAANRLIENLILAGCTGINPQEDDLFDFNRHATRPFSLPSNQLIKKTIRLGVILNDEVLVKAIVELK